MLFDILKDGMQDPITAVLIVYTGIVALASVIFCVAFLR